MATYSLEARVVDENDSLAYGNIILLSLADSSIIKGAYYTNGKASLTGIGQAEALVQFTSIGFKDTIIFVSNPNFNEWVDLGTVVLKEASTTLEEVSLTARVPLYEATEDGGVRVNVENTMLASSSGIMELLSKSPNVQIRDNSIAVIGKGEAMLYLNGVQITMEQLSSIAVGQVKEIVVITNPSARYDASGRAVIDIRTKDLKLEGIKGTIIHNSTFARSYLGDGSANVDFRTGKWAFSGGLGFFRGRDWDQLTATRTLNTDMGVFVSENFHDNQNLLANYSNYNAGIAYSINEKNKVSIGYRGFFGAREMNEAVQNRIVAPDSTLSFLATQNDGSSRRAPHTFILNYICDLDTLGSSLFVGGQYSRFRASQNDLIQENFSIEGVPVSSALRKSDGLTKINLITSQVDYVKRFRKKQKLELGTKFGKASNSGKVDFSSRPEGAAAFQFVPALSNDFEYDENIPAAYAQFGGALKGFKYLAGARGEWTIAQGYSVALEQQVIDTNYLNVFPSASLSYDFTPVFSAGLGYSARIDRPKYQQLDPFVYYQDSLTSFQGNPLLLPTKTQSLELNFNIQGFNFLKLGYNDSKDAFRDIVEPGDTGPNSVILRTVNVQRAQSYFAALNLPTELGFWTSYTTLSLTFEKILDSRPQFQTGRILPLFYLYTYHKFRFKSLFNLELFLEYNGKQNDGIYLSEPTYAVTAAASKDFFKEKVTFRILGGDIFRSFRQAGSFQVGNTNVVYDTRLNTNFFRFSLTYKFGSLKVSSFEIKETGKDERERIQRSQ